jgi:hypothetical protein
MDGRIGSSWIRLVADLCLGLLGLLLLVGVAGCDGKDRVVPAGVARSNAYVGSERCGWCHGPYLPAKVHGTYHADWLSTTHGKTGQVLPSDNTLVCDSDGDGENDFREGIDMGVLTAWSQYTVAGGASGDFAPVLGFDLLGAVYTVRIGLRTFEVDRIAGVGRYKQLYLTRMENARYVLPVEYDVAAKTWRPFEPENWFLWIDGDGNGRIDPSETVTAPLYASSADDPVGAGRTGDAWERRCAGCHVTGLTTIAVNPAGEFIIQYGEDGVGCEACHGPGYLHATDMGGKGYPDRLIVNPKKLAREACRDICMSCHSRGISAGSVNGDFLEYPWRADGMAFLPGQPLTEAFTLSARPDENLHPLQGNETHMGLSGSRYGAWSVDCQDCHGAHDAVNLSQVASTIATPNSGDYTVIFTARGGTPGSGGLMGDASDGAYTDICEVCHTRTAYFRNDPSTPLTGHFNGEVCTTCHPHSRGFRFAFSGGGGSLACDVCHGSLFLAMRDASATSYHHRLDDAAAAYPTDATVKRCLSCHVDHAVFQPDLNAAGGRGANLRTDIAEVPTVTTGFANTDYLDTGSGGICLSCHRQPLAKGYTQPDGTEYTPAVPFGGSPAEQVAAYGASPHGGSYTVSASFTGSGTSTFSANCSKCHNDTLNPKSGVEAQTGTHRFGLHVSSVRRMLGPLGIANPGDPLEESFCFRCHSAAGDPVGGAGKPAAGRDWYDAVDMSARAERIHGIVTGRAYRHAVQACSGLHAPGEGATPLWNPAGGRHVECVDCHNPHASGPPRGFDRSGTFAQPVSPTNRVDGGPLYGVWGVDVPAWPGTWIAPDPNTMFVRVEVSTYGWQVCLKCHSGYAYGSPPPAGQTDPGLEFNPNNVSYHAVIGSSRTTYPPSSSFVSPWDVTSVMSCHDCHTTDGRDEPQGPHGSSHPGILAGRYDTATGNTGTGDHLCYKCHAFAVYSESATASGWATGFSMGGNNRHRSHLEETIPVAGGSRKITCLDCHAAVPHGWLRRSLLVFSTDPPPYNRGEARLLSIAGFSGSWRKQDCTTAQGCH